MVDGTLASQTPAPSHSHSFLQLLPTSSNFVYFESAGYALIAHVDERIGLSIETLKKRGELENTLVFSPPITAIWRGTIICDGNLCR